MTTINLKHGMAVDSNTSVSFDRKLALGKLVVDEKINLWIFTKEAGLPCLVL